MTLADPLGLAHPEAAETSQAPALRGLPAALAETAREPRFPALGGGGIMPRPL